MLPKAHPRYLSLKYRHLIDDGVKKGIVTPTGMIAHGRGEALDYLMGEKTSRAAEKAAEAAAAMMLLAERAVVSVNGNAAVLAADEIIKLAKVCNAKIEANVFYAPAAKRRKLIVDLFWKKGAHILGRKTDAKIKGLSSERANVSREGIYKADVVLVMLEDGDRTEALRKAGKKVIAIDLNPLSRTAVKADVSIADNIVRALPLIAKKAKSLKRKNSKQLKLIVRKFSNKRNIKESLKIISKAASGP